MPWPAHQVRSLKPEAAAAAFTDQIHPFLFRTFGIFLYHLRLTLQSVFGVNDYCDAERTVANASNQRSREVAMWSYSMSESLSHRIGWMWNGLLFIAYRRSTDFQR